MTLSVLHSYVSTVPDDANPDTVSPSDWNAEHVVVGVREQLTADRTYYVRTDGSDSNDGLTDTAGGAFLAVQKAIDVLADTIDIAGYNVTIQLADGTYSGFYPRALTGAPNPLSGFPVIKGNASTPANVVVSQTNDATAVFEDAGYWKLLDFKITNTNNNAGIFAQGFTHVEYGNMNFGSCGAGAHVWANRGAMVQPVSNYTISGGAGIHIFSGQGATIEGYSITITLTGTPAFSAQFARVRHNARLTWSNGIFTGSATGSRYHAGTGGFLDTDDAGANYFPGDSAGTIEKGGWYDDQTSA